MNGWINSNSLLTDCLIIDPTIKNIIHARDRLDFDDSRGVPGVMKRNPCYTIADVLIKTLLKEDCHEYGAEPGFGHKNLPMLRPTHLPDTA
jgi:hypothetical protein